MDFVRRNESNVIISDTDVVQNPLSETVRETHHTVPFLMSSLNHLVMPRMIKKKTKKKKQKKKQNCY